MTRGTEVLGCALFRGPGPAAGARRVMQHRHPEERIPTDKILLNQLEII